MYILMEPIWWNHPEILWSQSYLNKLFPDPDSPLSNAYNAVVRFAVVGGLILFALKRDVTYLLSIPFTMLGTYLLYSLLPAPLGTTAREHFRSAREEILYSKPSIDNPFMTVTRTENENEKLPPADITRPSVARSAEAMAERFNEIPVDMSDPYTQRSFVRQFVPTIASHVSSNKMDAYLKAIYGSPKAFRPEISKPLFQDILNNG